MRDDQPDAARRSERQTPWWIRVGLAIYAAIVIRLLFTGGPPPIPGGHGRMVNLAPTKTIVDAVTIGNSDAKMFLVLNTIMLMPVGAFMALERIRPCVAVISIILVSFLIETTQYVIPGARSSDIDDLLLNSAGGIIAFWITRRLVNWPRHKNREGMQDG